MASFPSRLERAIDAVLEQLPAWARGRALAGLRELVDAILEAAAASKTKRPGD